MPLLAFFPSSVAAILIAHFFSFHTLGKTPIKTPGHIIRQASGSRLLQPRRRSAVNKMGKLSVPQDTLATHQSNTHLRLTPSPVSRRDKHACCFAKDICRTSECNTGYPLQFCLCTKNQQTFDTSNTKTQTRLRRYEKEEQLSFVLELSSL